MAYAITHLCVAWRLLEEGAAVENRAVFLMGAVAPDAVPYRDGEYSSDMKLFAHIGCDSMDVIPEKWGYITEIAAWRDRILRFRAETQDYPYRDFLLGYLVHIFTDLCNTTEVWQPFLKTVGGTFDREDYRHYGNECRALDEVLLINHPARAELESTFAASVPHGIRRHGTSGEILVSEAEVTVLRENVLSRFEASELPDVSGHRFVTLSDVQRLIGRSCAVSKAELYL